MTKVAGQQFEGSERTLGPTCCICVRALLFSTKLPKIVVERKVLVTTQGTNGVNLPKPHWAEYLALASIMTIEGALEEDWSTYVRHMEKSQDGTTSDQHPHHPVVPKPSR